MEALGQIGLSNTVAAALLAVAAAAVAWCRRPALAHALWLLVLVKLIAPPLLPVSVPWPTTAAAQVTAPAPEPEPVEVNLTPEAWALPPEAEESPTGEAAPAVEIAPAVPAVDWQRGLLAVWGLGTLAMLGVAAVRTWRFQRGLRYGRRAPAWLQAETRRLAEQLGLKRCPGVWLLPGRVSPMLWALGGAPRLFLPAGLLDRLDAAGREALLAHELAHLRRGDHLVRWLELLVTGLYWWNPVLWWARKGLREAEEQCCDAWVVWALPRLRRHYALALVEAVDFLSESPAPLPGLASGVGEVLDLRRRLTMIMRGSTPRALGRGGWLGLFGVGALLLPLLPTWAQPPEPPRPPRESERREIRVYVTDDDKREGGAKRDGPKADPKEIERARAELDRAKEELARAHERMRDAEAKLREAAERMARVAGEAKRIEMTIRGGDARPREGSPAGRADEERQRAEAVRARVAEELRERGRDQGHPRAGGPDDARIRDLERRLEDVMREMERMRRELRREPGDRPMGPQAGPRDGVRRPTPPPGGDRREERRDERREEGGGRRPVPPPPPERPEAPPPPPPAK